jgi:uncharacterized membrane protein
VESKAKLLGHPIHPMLVVFPLGLLVTSVLFDIIGLLTTETSLTSAAFYMIGVGVVVGVIAAIFGLIDWISIPLRTRAKGIGLWHGLGNALMLGFFGASWFMRRDAPEAPAAAALVLSVLGVLLSAVTGWLGGELVYRMGVGVDKDAALSAPNSMSKKAPVMDEKPIVSVEGETEKQYDTTTAT